VVVLAALYLAACAHPLPLEGRIWDTRAAQLVSPEKVYERASRARHVILGETHDNAEHHRLQRAVLDALAGTPRLLAMEQFDSEYQAAIDAARPLGVETVADAGHFDRKGWNWPLYRPLVEFALDHGWPIAAANLSRSEARAVVADPARSGLPPAPPAVQAALERDIVEGHCGKAPDANRLSGMVEAQRARDARMASVIRGRSSVLIAGNGHARPDRGVPLYLGDGDVLSIAFTEVQPGKRSPRDYDPESYDYLWFTPRASREDPCK